MLEETTVLVNELGFRRQPDLCVRAIAFKLQQVAKHTLLSRTIRTMSESRFRCEAEDEFNRRYYHWALEDAEREVVQGFPFISRIKDKTALEFLLVMRSLPLNEQLSYSRALVKYVFQYILKDANESLTDAEYALWKDFRRRKKAVGRALYREGFLENLDTKVKCKTVRKLIEAEVDETIGTLFSSEGARSFEYRRTIGSWNVDTFFGCGGRAKLSYMQRIMPLEETNLRIKPLAVVDLLIWQGIGQMGWNLMTDEDVPLAANLLANVCTHFMNIVPDLLSGLSSDLIPPEQP